MSDLNEIRNLLSQLIKLANADKELKDSEFQFLLTLSQMMGFPEDQFRQLFEEFIEFQPPPIEMDRILQFHRLILLMNVDQEIDEKELDMIRTSGIRMGLSPLAVAEVLDVMHDYPNKVIPPEKLLDIFKTFHN